MGQAGPSWPASGFVSLVAQLCHVRRSAEACSGIKRVLGLWSWRGRGFQRGRRLKFAAGAEGAWGKKGLDVGDRPAICFPKMY